MKIIVDIEEKGKEFRAPSLLVYQTEKDKVLFLAIEVKERHVFGMVLISNEKTYALGELDDFDKDYIENFNYSITLSNV